MTGVLLVMLCALWGLRVTLHGVEIVEDWAAQTLNTIRRTREALR